MKLIFPPTGRGFGSATTNVLGAKSGTYTKAGTPGNLEGEQEKRKGPVNITSFPFESYWDSRGKKRREQMTPIAASATD